MAKAQIPLRPKDFVSSLTQPEMAALTWYVLSGCAKKEAFLLFCRPDMLDSKAKAAIDDYVRQFFAQKATKDYIDAYQKTLDEFLHPAPVRVTAAPGNGTMEERKARAKTKLVEFAMNLANNIDQAEDPEFVLKMADKAGLLDGDEQAEEQPRRYLPISCSGCEYRKFVEENCDRVDDGTEIAEEI